MKRAIILALIVGASAFAARAWACGEWLADTDPSLPQNTSAYSNFPNSGGYSCSYDGTYGWRFECVELANRYYAQRWGFPNTWGGNAKDFCSNHPSGIRWEGSSCANYWHGDLMVWPAYTCGTGQWGHVAVVDGCNSDGTVSVVEQNWSYSGRRNVSPSCGECGLWTYSNYGPYTCTRCY